MKRTHKRILAILSLMLLTAAYGLLDPDMEKATKTALEAAHPEYYVTRVVDGDTIQVNIDQREQTVRLIGVDTPETKDPRKKVECFGQEASDKTRELVEGKVIKLEFGPKPRRPR